MQSIGLHSIASGDRLGVDKEQRKRDGFFIFIFLGCFLLLGRFGRGVLSVTDTSSTTLPWVQVRNRRLSDLL
jgi:hypothetical protein